MIGQTISHYKILEELGRGGMGVVYKAEDTKLKRTVALKFLPPELTSDKDAKTRFIHEARAASALQHHNICAIHEIDESSDGHLYISMDCYEGETLKQKIGKGPLPANEAMDIVIQIAEGLSEAHDAGMVHRDIKPANIMVTDKGIVKILDFGLAKLAGMTKVTKTGRTVGTVSYMSPEQATGEDLDARSDIFSLGAVLYELLTGEQPFRGDHEAAVKYGVMNKDPDPPSDSRDDISRELDRIVLRALEKKPKDRYQSAGGVLGDLRTEKRILEFIPDSSTAERLRSRRSRRRLKWASIPVMVVFLTVLLLLIFKPFRLEFEPEQMAGAAENTLAIMYFDNVADRDDPGQLGEITTNLLITDLSESEYIKVISAQRLYDILKLEGKEGDKVVDRETATSVALRANARQMLLGSILQVDPNLVITSQLVDVSTGTVTATQKITGKPGEGIFSLVDELTREIKNDLALPAAAADEADHSVSDVTTSSQEAYRWYLEGLDGYHKFHYGEAVASFERAVEYDSTFAMAYYWITITSRGDGPIDKAVQYSDGASRKEKKLIATLSKQISGDRDGAVAELEELIEDFPDEKEAYRRLGLHYRGIGETEKAIANWNKVIVLDPLDRRAYNLLAYDYFSIGEEDSAIVMINKYIELAPDEANPYDTRGDLYAWSGQIKKAIDSYKKAEELEPGFSVENLGDMYIYQGEYEEAKKCYRELLTWEAARTRARARLKLAFIPLFQGKLDDALDVLNQGISADQLDGYEGNRHNWKHYHKWLIYAEKEEWARSIAEAELLFESTEKSEDQKSMLWRAVYIRLLAQMGDFPAADKVLAVLESEVDEAVSRQMDQVWFAQSQLELERGNPEAACMAIEKVDPDGLWFYRLPYDLGRAYLSAGRLSQAVEILETYTDSYIQYKIFLPLNVVKAHYYLGIAYEESGWNDKAIEQYEVFLEKWKDADPGLQEVEDARRRLAAIHTTSDN